MPASSTNRSAASVIASSCSRKRWRSSSAVRSFESAQSKFEYWAGRFGKQDTQQILEELLEDHDAGMRRAAVVAARAAQNKGLGQDPKFGRAFARLALHDDDAEVRKAAGQALADVGEPLDIRAISAGIARKETRQRAREAAVNIALEGATLRGFTAPQRVRAKLTARTPDPDIQRRTSARTALYWHLARRNGRGQHGACSSHRSSSPASSGRIGGRWTGNSDNFWMFWTVLGFVFPSALISSALVGTTGVVDAHEVAVAASENALERCGLP